MTIGDIVLVNAFLIQLYILLNFSACCTRDPPVADRHRAHVRAHAKSNKEIDDAADAQVPLPGPAAVRFEKVELFDPSDHPVRGRF